MDLEFIKHRKDIILIGNPGVGKSFLAKCMAYAATQAGLKVLFTTAMDMINHLIAAEADHSLLKKLQYYQSQELLVIDETHKDIIHYSSFDPALFIGCPSNSLNTSYNTGVINASNC